MAKQTVEALVQGGKASAGPPLGPALGPAGVKIPDVIAAINEKTKDLAGMDVPIKVVVADDKSFEIVVGTPPTSALIKRELGIEKGSKEAGKLRAGDLTQEQVLKVSKMKFGDESPSNQSQVIGTARSMGISFGQGEVTQEEIQAYEEAKEAEKVEAAPAEGEAEATEGEKKEDKPAEAPKDTKDAKTEKKGK